MTPDPPDPRGPAGALALCLRLVGAVSRLAPGAARADWRREWTAELWHRWRSLERRGQPDLAARVDLVLRALGALPDALALRGEALPDELRAVAGGLLRRPAQTGAALLCLSLAVGSAALCLGPARAALASPAAGPGGVLLAAVALAAGLALLAASARAAGKLLGAREPRAFLLAVPAWVLGVGAAAAGRIRLQGPGSGLDARMLAASAGAALLVGTLLAAAGEREGSPPGPHPG